MYGDNLEKCLFCDVDLAGDGSLEHVFLAALGGRVATTHAVCLYCNNAFARSDTRYADQQLPKFFEWPRNMLHVWGGRDSPPPTIRSAQLLQDEGVVDYAPGLTPLRRPERNPSKDNIEAGPRQTINASSQTDAARQLEILQRRGYQVEVVRAEVVRQVPPPFQATMQADIVGMFCSVAKTALTAACVLYGNTTARRRSSPILRSTTRNAMGAIEQFVSVDYVNPWPSSMEWRPHKRTPDSEKSGFEHSVVFSDVSGLWLAYINLFGDFRFVVELGQASGLLSKGLGVNPRSTKLARFEVSALMPTSYSRLLLNQEQSLQGLRAAMSIVHKQCVQEGCENLVAGYRDTLLETVKSIGPDDALAQDRAVRLWAEEVAMVIGGHEWRTAIDVVDDAD